MRPINRFLPEILLLIAVVLCTVIAVVWYWVWSEPMPKNMLFMEMQLQPSVAEKAARLAGALSVLPICVYLSYKLKRVHEDRADEPPSE